MDEKDKLEFQDIMGNQLCIMTMKYRKCLDGGLYPIDAIKIIAECAGKVFLASTKFLKVLEADNAKLRKSIAG